MLRVAAAVVVTAHCYSFVRRFALRETIGLLILILMGSRRAVVAQVPPIVEKPIVWNEERLRLTQEYLREHYGIITDTPAIVPRMIVVHWTAYPTLERSYEAFYAATLTDDRPNIRQASQLNVSVPYLIDRDGTVYRLMPDTLMARHVIGLNHCAIGIENVGDGQNHPLTPAQLAANVQLIRYLTDQYPIEYLIGHHEYRRFIGHPLWKERDPTYLTDKDDPGEAFMHQLRKLLSDLPLRAAPSP